MFFKRKSRSPEKLIGDQGIDLEYALFTADRHKPPYAEVDRSQLQGGLGWAAGVKSNGWAIDHFNAFPSHLELFTDQAEDFFVGPWVMEGRADPFDPKDYNDGPKIAVSFRLYYNACEVGLVRFKPYSWLAQEDEKIRRCIVAAEIGHAAMLPYDHIWGLLMLISEPLRYGEDGTASDERQLSAHRSLQAVVWEAQRQKISSVMLDFWHMGYAHLSDPVSPK